MFHDAVGYSFRGVHWLKGADAVGLLMPAPGVDPAGARGTKRRQLLPHDGEGESALADGAFLCTERIHMVILVELR